MRIGIPLFASASNLNRQKQAPLTPPTHFAANARIATTPPASVCDVATFSQKPPHFSGSHPVSLTNPSSLNQNSLPSFAGKGARTKTEQFIKANPDLEVQEAARLISEYKRVYVKTRKAKLVPEKIRRQFPNNNVIQRASDAQLLEWSKLFNKPRGKHVAGSANQKDNEHLNDVLDEILRENPAEEGADPHQYFTQYAQEHGNPLRRQEPLDPLRQWRNSELAPQNEEDLDAWIMRTAPEAP